MKKIFTFCMLFFFILISRPVQAQPVVGSLAADWTFQDIDNVSHHLYSYLDSSYMVIIDISATWCAPCWSFHNTHIADTLTSHYGPNGSITPRKIKFFFFEGDALTGNADLYGNTSASQGNWVAGANYTIIDTSGLNAAYHITGYPTLIAICPDKRVTFTNASLGSVTSEAFWVNLMNNCPAPSADKDAALLSTEDVVNLCSNTVLLQNLWNQPLTSATIEMYSGANLVASQPWTGSLAPFGLTGISFPAGALTDGQGMLDFRLNVAGDVNVQNDSVSSAYDIKSLSGNKIRIEIKTDPYPYEDSWALLDGDVMIANKEYGLSDTVQAFTYDYTVNDGACLRFALYDRYGDGMSGGTSFTTADDGYIKIVDGDNNNLLDSVAGMDISQQFVRHYRAAGTPSSVNENTGSGMLHIFPNPANGIVTLTFGSSGMLTVTDVTGRKVYSGAVGKGDRQENRLQFSVQNWPAGIYLLCLQSGNGKVFRKLQVIH